MKTRSQKPFQFFESPALAVALDQSKPLVAYLGLESSARTRRHIDNNLLNARRGISFPVKGNAKKVKMDKEGITYFHVPLTNGKSADIAINFPGPRKIRISFSSSSFLPNRIMSMAFRTDIAPATVWGTPIGPLPKTQYKEKDPFEVSNKEQISFQGETLIHFPDYGLLKVNSPLCRFLVHEKAVPNPELMGFADGLGYNRKNAHMAALHFGFVQVDYVLPTPTKKAIIELTCDQEHYPRINGADFSSNKWNGLKRCWQNAFTLNPSTRSMGDNIGLSGIAHLAIHFKSDMFVFTPPLLKDLPLGTFFRDILKRSFTEYAGPDGSINWINEKGKKREPGYHGYFDCTASNLISFHDYLRATSDWSLHDEISQQYRGGLRFLLSWDKDGDGILEFPFHGKRHIPNRAYLNWWDDFAFGHKDAYLNLLSYRALKESLDVLDPQKDGELAEKIREFTEQFKKRFDPVFFCKKSGTYAGWIDTDGKAHDYMFTFIAGMAINLDLVPQRKAEKILEMMLAKLDEEGYGSFKYGVPGNLISVDRKDLWYWELFCDWGKYENGGLCGQVAYHFIQALYKCGMRKEADKILFTMMETFEKNPTHSGLQPGFAKSVDWRTKEGHPTGYNYLADNYYFLLAGITGHYNIPLPQIKKRKR